MSVKNREYIINTLYDDFDQLIPDETIEKSLVKLGLISIVSKSWLKEHYIKKQLSAKECATLLDCSIGHVQKKIQDYKLNKKRFGITNGNNQAHRRMLWKRKQQNNQPHRKEVVIFHIDSTEPLFECPSITAAAKKLNLSREHIRDCLNPNKKRQTAGGFRFELKSKQNSFVSSYISPRQNTTNCNIDDLVSMCNKTKQDIKYV